MLLSAEIRLFWFDNKPESLERWFTDDAVHRFAPGGGNKRTDIYLRNEDQIELGVKTRGGTSGVEIKGLVAVLRNTLQFNSCEIPIEVWSKWSSQTLTFDTKAGVTLHKTRWQRKFDTAQAQPVEVVDYRGQSLNGEPMPEKGCNVEWTVVEIPSSETCWTLGFEAYGHLQDVENSLQSVVRLMIERNPPHAPGAIATSYPRLIANRFSK